MIYRDAKGNHIRVTIKRDPFKRAIVERVDGEPVIVGGASYPKGYVAAYGDMAVENFLNTIKDHLAT